MQSNRRFRVVVLVITALALGVTQALAATPLVLHWDKQAGESLAVVEDSTGAALAEFPWNAALPTSYIYDDDEIEIPTFIAGELRDQLEMSNAPEAEEALEFVRGLMGAYADTPLENMSSKLTILIRYTEIGSTEWCGTSVNSAGECVAGGPNGGYNPFCGGFACKGTTIQQP